MFRLAALILLIDFHAVICKTEAVSDDFVLNYLSKFGYISHSRSGNNDATVSVKKFQQFFGLPATGELDEETVEMMKKPRCGNPDADDNGLRVRRYDVGYGKWEKSPLKYHLSFGEDLAHDLQARIFANAFRKWSDAAPKLRFIRTFNREDADLKIRSLGSWHYPSGRPNSFDEAEKWTEKGSRFWSKTESLYQVATHEIGHALGLGHSRDADAVMWPLSKKGKPKLTKDDIAGIRKLYGRWLKPRNDVT
ncbi:matrilysin-like [Porites lutea]|uniref:matrilysin-like n=1 Tax=Porites lutea TaxID=51062 RepID=UPI003CC5436D